MRLISYPFRLAPNGEVATVEQGSDAFHAELLAVLVRTRLGERVLVPAFGVPDPVFGELSLDDVAAGVALFGPPVAIQSVRVDYPDALTQEVRIDFR